MCSHGWAPSQVPNVYDSAFQNNFADVRMDLSLFRVLNRLRDKRNCESGFPCGGRFGVCHEF